MRRAIFALLIIMALALLTTAASAATLRQTRTSQVVCLHVIPQTQVDPFALRWGEAAIAHQVNTQVSLAWHTPQIRFCNWGWPVFIRKGSKSLEDDCACLAFHSSGWRPFAVVYVDSGRPPLVRRLDHEILEMMVDPWNSHVINGRIVEICDPVMHHPYLVWGIKLVDWVTPAWFGKDNKSTDVATGPTDWVGATTAPLQVRGGVMPDRVSSGSQTRSKSKL